MVLYTGTSYKYLTIPADGVTIGQLVVGMAYNWTLNHTSGTMTPLRFERTDGVAPRISLSRPVSSGDGDFQFRLGEYDKDNGGNVLDVSFVGKTLEVDFCGDSVSAGSYVRMGALNFAFGRGRIQVPPGRNPLRALPDEPQPADGVPELLGHRSHERLAFAVHPSFRLQLRTAAERRLCPARGLLLRHERRAEADDSRARRPQGADLL